MFDEPAEEATMFHTGISKLPRSSKSGTRLPPSFQYRDPAARLERRRCETVQACTDMVLEFFDKKNHIP
jgi:hypothetical protein